MSYFRIRNLGTREVIEGTPSPRLIQEGGGEAWNPDGGAFWRVREDGDPEGTVYTRVSIEHTEDYRVDVRIKPTISLAASAPFEDVEAYDDFFIVKAASEQEAYRLASAAAAEDVENRYGEEYGSDVTVIRARRGVSF